MSPKFENVQSRLLYERFRLGLFLIT